MKRIYQYILLVMAAVMLSSAGALANMSDYQFEESTGSATDLSSASTISGTTGDDAAGSANIGFTFNLDGTDYTTFTASSNGVVGLGSYSTTTYSNNLTGYSPIITAWWDDMYADNYVQYVVTGSAPNRVLVIAWNVYALATSSSRYHYEVRLHETSNEIDFYYGSSTPYSGQSASIGVCVSSSNYASVSPGSPATVSNSSANNGVGTFPSSGTIYRFTLCTPNIDITGNTSQGGTSSMAQGDTLLVGYQEYQGHTLDLTPFMLSQGSRPCNTRGYVLSIGGAYPGDYSVAPTSGTVDTNQSVTPTLTFAPHGVGIRYATLTIRDDNGLNRQLVLAAEGLNRINWIGDTAQGGTLTMADGDTLMSNLLVLRGDTAVFTPVTIENFGASGGAGAPVSVTISDPSGQFTVLPPATATLDGGQTYTPQIQFIALGVSYQYATMTITADGQVRTFPLKLFSAAPAGDMFVDGTKLGPDVSLYRSLTSCVGEVANTKTLTVKNTGYGGFILQEPMIYRTDTAVTATAPPYPVLIDAFGQPIPAEDYVITRTPPVLPNWRDPANMVSWPDTVAAGQTATYYLTFVSSEPGKRYARAFFHTNGQNIVGTDYDGQTVDGLLTFSLVGRGIGGQLSDMPVEHQAPKPIVFANEVRVGDSVDMNVTWYNTGDCSLKVDLSRLRIIAGDVNDFRLVTAFGQTVSPAMKGIQTVSPDSTMTLRVRFLPQRSGSRRATIRIQTNDSAEVIPGISNRGEYRIDVYGQGQSGLDYVDVSFPPTLVGGTSQRGVKLENSSVEAVEIVSIDVVGADSLQFAEDGSQPWPTLPHTVLPGEQLTLSVVLTPTGAPGMRTARLRLTLSNGQVIEVPLSGEAGVQTLVVTPTTLFTGSTITAGTVDRAEVAVTNTGTLPIVLQQPTISGADGGNYTVTPFARLVLDAGATEILEVTFAPDAARTYAATMTIMSNAGNQTVTLGGNGAGIKPAGGADDQQVRGQTGGELTQNGGNEEALGVAGVERSVEQAGVTSLQVSPNPTSGRAVVGWHQSRRATVGIALYDATGRAVQEVTAGEASAGDHSVAVDGSGLESGVYLVRLTVDGATTTRRLVIMR